MKYNFDEIVERKNTEMSLGISLSSVEIHAIAECLKSVERDPDREQELERAELDWVAYHLEEITNRRTEEIQIFEAEEYPQIDREGETEMDLFLTLCFGRMNHQPREIGHRRRE